MKDSKNLAINIIVTMLYALFTLIMVFHHEIWADEAQAWLIAKNLSIFDFSLFKHLVNEGHPSFFYLLIMPFAKLNTSIIFMQILCWFCSVVSVFLLLKKSPFNNFCKFSIVISGGFLYFFPVIARSYSILPLIVFILAIYYKKAEKHPYVYSILLSILANTHVIMFAFCVLLAVDFIHKIFKNIKNKSSQHIISIFIIILSFLTTIIQLAGSEASNGTIDFNSQNILTSAYSVLCQFFGGAVSYIDTFMIHNMFMPPHVINYFVCCLLFSIFFIVLFIILFLKDKKLFFICFTSIVFQLMIYAFAYSTLIYPTRIFSAFLIIIFGYWILLEQKSDNQKMLINIVISIFFLITSANGISFIQKDIKYNYSSAKETAEYIKNNINKDALIIPTADAFGLGVYYYLPDYKFYSVYKHKEIKYMVWNKENITDIKNYNITFTKLLEKEIKKYNLKNKTIYILASNFMNTNQFESTLPEKYKLMYVSKPCFAIGEAFKIYVYQQN